MLKLLLAIGFMTGAGPLLASQPSDCPANPQQPPPPLSAWSGVAAPIASGERISLGENRAVTLVPAEQITWLHTPERLPAPASLGATLTFDIRRAGNYSIAISGGAWIEVARADGLVRSTNHGHGPRCSGIRKIVEFKLQPGIYTLQISSGRDEIMRLLVARK